MDPELVTRHREHLLRDGYTVIENAFDAATRDALIEGLLRLEREGEAGYARTTFEGMQTVRVYNLLARGEVFRQVPLNPAALAVAEAVLDPELLLSSLSAITLGPGQPAQPMHEDTQQIPLPRPHPPIAVNAMWALSPFTEDNGATRIVPASHLAAEPPVYGGAYETRAATMPAGSIMLFDSQLWHAGGANRTDERRFAISCYYCAGWLRQQENLQLGLPRETVQTFPRRLQELCGYSVYRGQYGHIDNRDPIELLGQPRRRSMVWEASDRRQQARPA
ncbi:Ectoine hydroxylase-related dioxygenase, phytanoyl-CoA dioxygenase (PhyH) family [Tistlia consotensis]|uniref:Ectoine hydroxylase-related dioxygenase, phytanoyl-CoA dioxygenase (PhyH) family n=1 Tax=Tistlia consotensis USBA 355 TaxID=560819 RepID=A0A1Y6B498_9PROT|nr:phytanoyl-CoA dioxygenase family protein [Tistlia consotensis]SME91139.1 Ectoine hydroxylase-related dioxygenase, phytanoyl-CoA dioxygenase (PhyH) family [Tistlia consotensis USBA 355]SNR27155.1 Ectoine hydroxylase-related dioxygenase, phytanoyl-CoA dioxygenase (PhyH) family [Tistlia consotensis]